MMYYISNELSHHGVKGMRWGFRKQRVSSGTGRRGNSSSSSGRKKMSTAKKVAIGAACVAAVAGVSYLAVKTHQTSTYNKAARAAVQRAMKTATKVRQTPDMKKINMSGKIQRKYEDTGKYGHDYVRQRMRHTNWSHQVNGEVPAKLTGHSQRLTKYGAARYNTTYKKKQMDRAFTYRSPRYMDYEDAYRTASEKMGEIVKANGGKVPSIYPSKPVNKLRRQKGPKILRKK